jgi:hypothetical protein
LATAATLGSNSTRKLTTGSSIGNSVHLDQTVSNVAGVSVASAVIAPATNVPSIIYCQMRLDQLNSIPGFKLWVDPNSYGSAYSVAARNIFRGVR